jgi:D-alanyl-D-alanine carboxypeptidase
VQSLSPAQGPAYTAEPLTTLVPESRMILSALLFALLPLQLPVASPGQPEPAEELRTSLERIATSAALPAMGGAILRGGEEPLVVVVGVRELGSDVPVQPTDLWHLGSCTKAMTATLAARLVEKGLISFETTLGEVCAEAGVEHHAAWSEVTLEQLLGHRAGVPADLSAGGLWDRLWRESARPPREQRRVLFDAVLAQAPVHQPGSAFLYSNASFALAGVMLELRTDKPWEDLMRAELFAPLGMSSAGFGAPGSAERLDQPRGHRAATEPGTSLAPVSPGPGSDNPASIGPAGTVHASLADWARFLGAHLDGFAGRGEFLEPETWARLHRPLADQDYGQGWLFTERPWAPGLALTHSGSNTFWFCTAWLAPGSDFAVLVTANAANAGACDEAAGALVRLGKALSVTEEPPPKDR